MSDDLRALIAGVRGTLDLAQAADLPITVSRDHMRKLLNAAERSLTAKEALQDIVNAPLPVPFGTAHELQNIARRALSRYFPVVPT